VLTSNNGFVLISKVKNSFYLSYPLVYATFAQIIEHQASTSPKNNKHTLVYGGETISIEQLNADDEELLSKAEIMGDSHEVGKYGFFDKNYKLIMGTEILHGTKDEIPNRDLRRGLNFIWANRQPRIGILFKHVHPIYDVFIMKSIAKKKAIVLYHPLSEADLNFGRSLSIEENGLVIVQAIVLIAAIENPSVIKKILKHLGLPTTPPTPWNARGPPQSHDDFNQQNQFDLA
jgi:hypothetical protein